MLLISQKLSNIKLDNETSLERLVEKTENYSGSDLMNLLKEIKMSIIREISYKKPTLLKDKLGKLQNAIRLNWQQIESALVKVRPMWDANFQRYEIWSQKFGSV